MPELDANKKNYSFSSIGETVEEELAKIEDVRILSRPFGFKFPLSLNDSQTGFAIHDSMTAAIADNLHHLILTNHGERVGNYYFGANLSPLLHEAQSSPTFEAEVGRRIANAVTRFMPYVELQEFNTSFVPSSSSEVKKFEINLTYTIPRLSQDIRGKRIVMFIGA